MNTYAYKNNKEYKFFSQYSKTKKYKKKRLATKKQENMDIANCIKQINDSKTVTPLLNSFFIPFLNKKDYTDGSLIKRRQEITKEICKDRDYVSIPTVIVSKRRYGGVEKTVSRQWHHILVQTELILEWYALESKEVLAKAESGRNVDMKMIIKMFRNKFFVFFDSGKALDISGENKFMRMCIKKTKMMNGYIINLKKQNKNNSKLEEFLEDERKQVLYDIKNERNEAQSLYKFIDDTYAKINDEYEKSNKEILPKYPSILEIEEQYKKQKSSTLDLLKINSYLKKIDSWVINQIRRVLSKPSIKKIRSYRWESNVKTKFAKKDVQHKGKQLAFELLKIKNNTKAMKIVSRFMYKNDLHQVHRFLNFTKILDGRAVNVWNSEIDRCTNLITACDMKKKVFKWLTYILKKDRKKYFEFLESIGITRVKKYKKIKHSFSKEQWYNLVMLGYKQLLYG